MNATKKIITALMLGVVMLSALAAPALAADAEQDVAVQFLVENRIYKGDQNGNLHLDTGLTRAELATILCRINGDEQEVQDNLASFKLNCYFTDVPEWAKAYVGYCAGKQLMVGYDLLTFGANDRVNPQAACTVMLRYLGYPETDWDYSTSVSKAQAVGITPGHGLYASAITRGDMAVVIYKAMTLEDQEQDEAPAMSIEEMKQEIIRLTNEERVKAGLPELKVLPELMDCAQAKAQDFFDSGYYGHTSPIYGTFGEMIRSFVPNAKGCGENIAPWRETLQEVFEEWTSSPGHRDNIIEPRYTHIGVGIVEGMNGGYWWVQQFAAI